MMSHFPQTGDPLWLRHWLGPFIKHTQTKSQLTQIVHADCRQTIIFENLLQSLKRLDIRIWRFPIVCNEHPSLLQTTFRDIGHHSPFTEKAWQRIYIGWCHL